MTRSLRASFLGTVLLPTLACSASNSGGPSDASTDAMMAGDVDAASVSDACPDPTSDPKNCGECGHDCLGAACLAGVCQPTVIATGAGKSLALDGAGNVYWTTDFAGGRVMNCATTGCNGTPTEVYSDGNSPDRIAIRGSTLVWVQTSGAANVMACTAASCMATAMALGPAAASFNAGLALDSANAYWTYADFCNQKDQVLKCALGGCGGNPTNIDPNEMYGPAAVAVDSTSAYVLTNQPLLEKCSISNCAGALSLSTDAYASDFPSPLTVDADNVYWENHGSLLSCSIAGCNQNPTVLAPIKRYGTAITVDPQNVYWAEKQSGIMGGDGRLMKCSKTSCNGNPTPLAVGVYGPNDIAVDDKYVYWTESGGPNAVLRVPK